MQAKSVGKLAAYGVGLAASLWRTKPRNVVKKRVVVETIWLPFCWRQLITVKRRCCSSAICIFPFGFSWQAQTCHTIENLNHVPRDSFDRTRGAVGVYIEITRIAPHLRPPLSLCHFITTHIESLHQSHLMRRAFVGIAAILNRRAASHRKCSRRNQQHFDVA